MKRNKTRVVVFFLVVCVFLINVAVCWEPESTWIHQCEDKRVYQQWTYIPSSHVIQYAVGANPDTSCLDASMSTGSSHSMPHTWGCSINNPNQNQVWNVDVSGAITAIQSRNRTALCLTAFDASEGGLVWMSPCGKGGLGDWQYNSTSKQFKLARTPYCLDAGVVNNSCSVLPFRNYAYCNSALTPKARAQDLVSRMSLADKTVNLQNNNFGVKRLGVPAFRFGEALHGVASGCGQKYNGNTGCPTSFPHALLLSSSFNTSLWSAIGATISTEARALSNQGVTGWAFWTPDINLFRDPRWGRGQEVPGEDPFLSGEYAMHYIPAMQVGSDPKYVKVVATAKHYVDYDLEGTYGVDRGSFNAIVNLQDQVAYYFPSFKAAVIGAKVKSIMCSYNAVNGIPSCGNSWFNNKVARNSWGFDGFFVSDCGAINDGAFNAYVTNNFYGSSDWQMQQAITGGTDVECGSFYVASLEHAVLTGVLNISDVDLAATRFYEQYVALGMLDSGVSYTMLGAAQVDSPSARALALSAAQQGITLLKNDGNLLPLSKTRSVALVGPHFNATDDLLSIYHGTNTLVHSHSPYQAIFNSKIPIAGFAKGCELYGTDSSGFEAAITAVKKADVAIVFVGLEPGANSQNADREDEGHDRSMLELPGVQLQLIQAVIQTGKPTVVVLIHGAPLAIEWVKVNVPAILDAKYPGELGGDAIASILFGDVSPAGRLTSTVYPANFINQRAISDMGLQVKGGITYQYYTGTPLWEFGYGLSYTTFSYKLKTGILNTTTDVLYAAYNKYYTTQGNNYGPGAVFEVTVTNTGKTTTSDVVVLGYTSSGVAGQPIKELFGFNRVAKLAPGAFATVMFAIPPPVISQVDTSGTETLRPGNYTVFFGDSISNTSGLLVVTGAVRTVFTLPPKPPIPSPELFSSNLLLGCYMDAADRDLPYQATTSGSTIESCRTACGIRQYYYSGLQNGGQCWCGNTYGFHGVAPNTDCNMKCDANSRETCGGVYRNSVYLVGEMGYVGCFSDGTPRDLPFKLSSTNTQTVEQCRSGCLQNGYTYAGVQFGIECWCGNTFGTHGKGSDDDCSMACSGDSTEICGNAGKNSIYTAKLLG